MIREPQLGLPGVLKANGTKCKVSRIWSPASRHSEIAVTVGPCQRAMHSCRPVLDTGAGLNLVRSNVLPANWRSYAEKLDRMPRIKDANNTRLVVQYAVYLYVDVGCVKVFDRFFVAAYLTVPCILGTAFMERHLEAIFTRLKTVVWQDHCGGETTRYQRRTPILATLVAKRWERSWEVQPAKVRACRQVRVNGQMEEWVMETCPTPGLVTISPNIRLCRHKSVAVARGVAVVKPDVPVLVKFCNFGPGQAIVRKNSILGFAESYQGPMLAAVTEHTPSLDASQQNLTYGDPVKDVDLIEAPEYLHKRIREILRTHSFMWDGTLGTIHATEYAIVTPSDALPIRAQPYRTGPFKRQIIAGQINSMLKMKVIEPSHSAWASPVVIVPKKNGKSRFCVDYRRLNNITKKDAYPLPRKEYCLESVYDAKLFTSLDFTAGYWQVPLRKAEQEKTAFTTHCDIYYWMSMPFGLTKAPARFQRALDIIQSGLTSQLCLVYLDDVIIFSATPAQHVKEVDAVLTRLREAGVPLNLEKCTWFSDEVEYLGHIVRPGQLHVHNETVDALKHATFPTTKTQLKSFLGMCNVYRRLFTDFAKRSKPLNALTRTEVPSELPKPSDAALAAFEDLRKALLKPPILALPKANGKMIADVDACANQLGCLLLQKQPESNCLPVGYWSQGLTSAEHNCCTTGRKCLVVVWSVLKFLHFLDGNRFLIRTNHQALSCIYSTDDSSGRLMRWRLRLSECTIDMPYKPGASHHGPDLLS